MVSRHIQKSDASAPVGALKRLWLYVLPYGWRVLLGIAAIFCTTAAMMLIPQHVRYMLDVAIAQEDVSKIDHVVLWLMLTVVVLVAGIFVRTITLRYTGIHIVANIRSDFYAKVVHQSAWFYESHKTAEIISRIVADVAVIRHVASFVFPQFVRGIMLLICSVAMLFYTSAKLTAVLVVAAPLFIIFGWWVGQRIRQQSKQIQQASADISVQVQESLNNLSAVRAFAQEDAEKKRLNTVVERALQASWQHVCTMAGFFSFNVFVGFSVIAFVMWLGGREVLAGNMAIGDMVAYFLYIAFLGDAFGSISNFWPEVQSAAGATERLFHLMDEKNTLTNPAQPVSLPKQSRGRTVSFKDVTFTYPARPQAPVIKDFNLQVNAGEQIAIVGPSGAGKTTLFALLMRFYEVDMGSICVDGVDIRQLDMQELRKNIGIVAQEPAIFSTTIGENIRYGRPDATDDEVKQAVAAAYLSSFIASLPGGLNTRVGERGVRLSGGQKQRLSIARTLLCNPPVLLLDEATSHLDAESEQYVQDALDNLMQGRTTLVIAHRLATVKAANRIVVLQSGVVQAIGSHAELLQTSPLYARLAELQFLDNRSG